MTVDLAAPGFFISVGPPAPGAGGRADSATQVDQSVRVLSLKFEDDEQKPDKLTLTIDNHDLSHLDSPLWRKGNVVEHQFGYPGRMSPPRTAIIQSVKGFSRLIVEAQSGDTLMNRVARPDRVFEQMKRSDVVREIVKEYGYRDDELDIEDTEIVLKQVTQGPLTDRQFIRQLAWREGFEFFVDFDGVHFHKRRRDKPPIKTYRYFTERGRGEMLGEPTIEDDISGGRGRKVGAIVMKGRDPSTGKPFEVRADNTTVAGRPTLMPTMTVHEVLVLDGTGEPRTEYRPLEVNGTEKVVAATETTEEGAKRQAAAHYEKHQMRAVKMSFSAVGDPNVVAKSVIKVEGIGATFSGLWYARNVTHDLTPGTEVYKMALKLSTDGVNGGAGGGAGGAPAGPPADGAPNAGGGSGGSGDGGEMEEVIVLDGTGEPRTEYRDRRGRSGSGS